MRRNRRMRYDDVPRRERGRPLADNVQKRVVVRNENLNVVTHLGQLGRRTHEIRDGSRVPVPNKNMETQTAQIVGDPASDDAEPDYTHLFPGSTRHWGLRGLFAVLAACLACGENRWRAI